MARQVKLSFYTVEECGYYKRGQDAPFMADFPSVSRDLHQWISTPDITVRETQTFSPDADSEDLPVFCYSLIHDGAPNDYVMTTWNETETTEGQVASVHADEAAGSARVEGVEVTQGTIAGYPAYFWLIPNQNLIASVRLEGQRLTGHTGFDLYMKGYLERFSKWVVLPANVQKATDVNVLGYKHNRQTRTDLRPRFRSVPVRLQGRLDYIRTNRQRIRKMLRKDEYEGGRVQHDSLVAKLLKGFGLRHSAPSLDKTRYRFEINYTPSEAELNEIINEYTSGRANTDVTRWDDIGFKFEKDNQIHWLSSASAKGEAEVNIRLRDGVVIEADSLLTALHAQRSSLLRMAADQRDE